jgi:hypothetical protein
VACWAGSGDSRTGAVPAPTLDDRPALSGEYEEALLRLFGVIERVRLAGPEHVHRDPKPREARIPCFDATADAELSLSLPGRREEIQYEPTLTGGYEACIRCNGGSFGHGVTLPAVTDHHQASQGQGK